MKIQHEQSVPGAQKSFDIGYLRIQVGMNKMWWCICSVMCNSEWRDMCVCWGGGGGERVNCC